MIFGWGFDFAIPKFKRNEKYIEFRVWGVAVMIKISNKSLMFRLCVSIFVMHVISLSSGCVYSIAGNVDVGGGLVDKDAYAVQRAGVSVGTHFMKIPVSLDLKINRESGQSLGDGDLDKKFFQDHNSWGLGLWLPKDSGWEPYLHVEYSSDDFFSLKRLDRKYLPMSIHKELAIGLRRSFPRNGNSESNCFYGYSIEGFASRDDVIAQDKVRRDIIIDKKVTTVGLRFTGFFDFGQGLPFPFFLLTTTLLDWQCK